MTDKHLDDRKRTIGPAGALRLNALGFATGTLLVALGLLILMAAGKLPWIGWPHLAAPMILLGIPVFFKSRHGGEG